MQPQTEVVCILNAKELLENLPGASQIQNGDDEPPTPVTPGNPDEIGAKSWFDGLSDNHSQSLWDD